MGQSSSCLTQDIPVVSHVDVSKYIRTKWFEVVRYYMFWERNCIHSIARYSLCSDEMATNNECAKNTIIVYNECLFDGEPSRKAKGSARFCNSRVHNGHLEVSFFPGVWGGYNIIRLVDYDEENDRDEKGYKYAFVVGDEYKYFWVLSTDPIPSIEESDTDDMIMEKKMEKSRMKKEICCHIHDLMKIGHPLEDSEMIWDDMNVVKPEDPLAELSDNSSNPYGFRTDCSKIDNNCISWMKPVYNGKTEESIRTNFL